MATPTQYIRLFSLLIFVRSCASASASGRVMCRLYLRLTVTLSYAFHWQYTTFVCTR